MNQATNQFRIPCRRFPSVGRILFRYLNSVPFWVLISWLGNPQQSIGTSTEKKSVLRVGHFPNITHAQALIGRGYRQDGKGWFESRLGPDVELQWFAYNAGPSAMEAILSRSIDLSYVGVTPALNAYIRTSGRDIRIVSGACSGGAALVVREDSGIQKDSDFRGKQLGTPQLGNTQDIAARAWLLKQGYKVTLTGGDVFVMPSANPDLFTLFKKKELDAVWTVEPWVSRLVSEAHGRVYLEESSLWKESDGRYATTLLVSSVRCITNQPALLRQFLKAHVELTEWIQQHPDEAQEILNRELKEETKKGLDPTLLKNAWKRLEFTIAPMRNSVVKAVEGMRAVGFYRKESKVDSIYDFEPLNEVLRTMNRSPLSP